MSNFWKNIFSPYKMSKHLEYFFLFCCLIDPKWSLANPTQCTTYFQCWLNGNFRSRLWLNCSVAKFYAMWQHTNNVQWQKNWVSCLLKLLSNYNFKLENHAIFYDFQSTLLIVPMCANLVRERSLKPNILLNYLVSSFQKCYCFIFSGRLLSSTTDFKVATLARQ